MIEINNLTNTPVDEDFLKGLAKKVLNRENKAKIELSIAFVGEKKIKEINKRYRREDKATDVLSFEGDPAEIIICLSEVKKNARKNDSDFKKELIKVFVHGIFHILGYSHSRKMEKKEKLWQNFK